MNRFYNLQVMIFVAVFCAVLSSSKADTVDSLKVMVSMFSGRPDPEYTITDSQSISYIKRRLDQYNLRSDPGDANAPMPLGNMGYRGVTVIEPKSNSIYNYYLSNGSAMPDYPQTEHRFFDRRQELEKMVLRLVKKEVIIHPQPDTQALSLIPDSLTLDYSYSGFLTFEINGKLSTDGMWVDASQLGNGSRYLSKNQDSISVVDFSLLHGAGDTFVIKSTLGVAALPQRISGLQPLGVVRPDSSPALVDSYRTTLLLAGINPETLTFQQQVSFKVIESTGITFIIKTSEHGYVALVTAGMYVGGIDRSHFFYHFTTANKFGPVNQTVNIRKQHIITDAILPAQKNSVKVTLTGQKIGNAAHVENQVFPGTHIRVK